MYNANKMKRNQTLYAVVIVAVIFVSVQVYRTVFISNVPNRVFTPSSSAVVTPSRTNTQALYKYADGIRFEIATTTKEQEKGLSSRTIIDDNYGMLFVFPQDGPYGFWMKDMSVPIDIMWLSDNGTIVSIENALATSTYPNVFYPSSSVKYVLETRSGFASKRGWSVGSVVQLPLPYGKEVLH